MQTLSVIEGELIQVRSEDPRMFPAKLNDNLVLRAEMELAKLDRCLAEDVAAFNARCREAGIAAIVPKP